MSPLLDSRDLNHRRRNGTTTPTGSEMFPREPSEHALGCQNVVQPAVQPYRPAFRPAFVDDVIQGGLPSSLKRKYKTILFACKLLFFPIVIQYK